MGQSQASDSPTPSTLLPATLKDREARHYSTRSDALTRGHEMSLCEAGKVRPKLQLKSQNSADARTLYPME